MLTGISILLALVIGLIGIALIPPDKRMGDLEPDPPLCDICGAISTILFLLSLVFYYYHI